MFSIQQVFKNKKYSSKLKYNVQSLKNLSAICKIMRNHECIKHVLHLRCVLLKYWPSSPRNVLRLLLIKKLIVPTIVAQTWLRMLPLYKFIIDSTV